MTLHATETGTKHQHLQATKCGDTPYKLKGEVWSDALFPQRFSPFC